MSLIDPTAIKTKPRANLIRLKDKAEVREAAILTTGYVASNEMDISSYNKAAVFFEVTKGSLTEVLIKVQQSIDEGVTWFDAPAEQVGLTEIVMGIPEYSRTLVGATERWFWVFAAMGQQMRVQIKGVGTVTSSECTLNIVGVY